MIETKFKKTDIGLIPEDWETKHLSQIMNIRSGGSITGDAFVTNGKYPVYGGNGIRGFLNSFNLDGNYILIGRVGALCGNIHFTNGKFFASEHALVCHPIDKYNSTFFASILEGMQLGQYSGASARPVLAAKKNERLIIPYPPIEEQDKIGKALVDVDELIDNLKKLVEKKRAIKQGAMGQLLTGKLRLPGFTEPLADCTLGELGIFIKGKGISRSESQSGNIPAIRYGEIYTFHNDYIKTYYSHISREVANRSFKLESGDLCFACSGETLEEIGKTVAFVDNCEAYAGGDIIILRPQKEICPTFWGFRLNMPDIVIQKANKGHGLSIMHISSDALSEIFVTCPQSLNEQQAITKVLTDMDKEIADLEAKLKKYEQVKQGMMQQLLTGKIRLI